MSRVALYDVLSLILERKNDLISLFMAQKELSDEEMRELRGQLREVKTLYSKLRSAMWDGVSALPEDGGALNNGNRENGTEA